MNNTPTKQFKRRTIFIKKKLADALHGTDYFKCAFRFIDYGL